MSGPQGPAEPGGRTTSRLLSACAQAMREVGADGAGVSLVSGTGQHLTLCSTDGVAGAVEDLQQTLGEGPCVDAVRAAAPVLCADLTRGAGRGRWPTFGPEAVAAGVRAIYAFPLRLGGVTLGAMDLYRADPGQLTARARLDGVAATHDVAVTVLTDPDVATLVHSPSVGEGATGGPSTALGPPGPAYHHFQIHQAAGMVSVQAGGSLEEALLIMRARAFSSRRSLLDVARDVVERRLRFTEED